MHRRDRLVPILCATLFVVGVLVQLVAGRGFELSGLPVDAELVIVDASLSPSSEIREGDRVVGVNGVPIDTPTAFASALRDAGDRAEVRIRQVGRQTTLRLTPSRLADEMPVPLRGAFEVVEFDGAEVGAAMDLDELTWRLEAEAPRPIDIRVVYDAHLVGPVAVRRSPPPLPGVLWLGIALVALIGAAALSSTTIARPLPDVSWRVVSTALGGIAGAALAATLATPFAPSILFAWAFGTAAVWRAASLLTHLASTRDGSLEPTLVGVLLAPGAIVAGVAGWAAWSGDDALLAPALLACALFVAVCALVDAAVHTPEARRPGTGAFIGLAAGGAVVVFGGALLALRPALLAADGPGALVLALVGVQWIADLSGVLSGEQAARARAPGGYVGGVRDRLVALADVAPDLPGALAVGLDGAYVIVRLDRGSRDGETAIRGQMASAELGDLLAMLETEGGMLPRTLADDIDEDAFDGVMARLGLRAAVPLADSTDATLAAWVVTFDPPDDPGAWFDIDAVVDVASRGVTADVWSELSVLASQTLLAEARRARREAPDPVDRPTSDAPAAASAPAPATPVSTAAVDVAGDALHRGWSQWMWRAAARAWPIDDPDVLDDRERRALGFLNASPGAVLLIGEPGVGKEFIARVVHAGSSRAGARFAAVDCALLPASLVEVELFGDGEVPGIVELAEGGTLLLKSASNLPKSLLESLLGRLDSADVRLVFAERYVGPEAKIPDGVPGVVRRMVGPRYLHLTPLRERPGDVRRYARWFLHRMAMQYDRVLTDFDGPALDALESLRLDANFHDLEACIRRAVLRADGEVVGRDALLGELDASEVDESDDETALEDDEAAERDAIVKALEETGGNRSEAARQLRMTRGKLLRRIKKYGIADDSDG